MSGFSVREAALAALDHGAMALLRHGPAALAQSLPVLLARHAGPRLYAGQIAHMRANLALLAPGLPPGAADEAMEHLARTMCESAVFPRLLHQGRVDIAGEEHARARPTLFVSVHTGCWPLAAAAAAMRLGHDLAGPHQPPPNRRRAAWLAEAFGAVGLKLLTEADGARGALLARRLREGRSVIMFVDADAVAPSLGRGPRRGGNLLATTRLARLSGLDPVPVHAERLGEPGRHRVTFHPPLRLPPDREAAVAALDAAAEALVRPRLTQWFFLPDFRANGG